MDFAEVIADTLDLEDARDKAAYREISDDGIPQMSLSMRVRLSILHCEVSLLEDDNGSNALNGLGHLSTAAGLHSRCPSGGAITRLKKPSPRNGTY